MDSDDFDSFTLGAAMGGGPLWLFVLLVGLALLYMEYGQ